MYVTKCVLTEDTAASLVDWSRVLWRPRCKAKRKAVAFVGKQPSAGQTGTHIASGSH